MADYYVEYRDTESNNKLSSYNGEVKRKPNRFVNLYHLKFIPSATTMNLSNNTITWSTHNLLDDDCVYYLFRLMVMMKSSILNRFDIYYVQKVDNNTIKLKDTSNNVINLTGYGTSVSKRHQLYRL